MTKNENAAKRNKITTVISEEYENQILSKTGTKSLEEAIEQLDRKRKMYPLEKITINTLTENS